LNDLNVLKQKCIDALAQLSGYDNLIHALKNDDDFFEVVAGYSNSISDIEVVKGLAPQNISEPPIDITFDSYLENIIKPLLSTDSPYDDRKLRLDKVELIKGSHEIPEKILLHLGPTIYQHYRQDIERMPVDALKLMLKGIEYDANPYSYFTKTVGVTAVALTQQGHVFLGERPAHIDYPEYMHFVGGLATFCDDIQQVNLYHDAQRELEEEIELIFGEHYSNANLVGVAGNPLTSEMDIVFIVETKVDDNFFSQCKLTEHQRLVRIGSKEEAQNLLFHGMLPNEKQPKSLIFSAAFALNYLIHYHF
jgi:hypothetical protein